MASQKELTGEHFGVFETGSVAFAHPIQKGRHRKLLRADEDYVLALMEHNPTLYLDEYVALLDQQRAISVSRSTMHRLFSQHNVSRKKAAKIASERNKLARADFKRRISKYAAHSLLFLDETSKDERTYFRSYARAPKGQEAEVSAPFVRGHRYTLLPAMDMTGIVAYKVVEGSEQTDLLTSKSSWLYEVITRSCRLTRVKI